MKNRIIAVIVTFLAVLLVLVGGFEVINHSSTDPSRMLIISNREQAQLVSQPSQPNSELALGEHQNEYNTKDLGVYRIERALNGGFVAKNKDRSVPLFDAKSTDNEQRTDRNLLGVQGGHYLDLTPSVYKNIKNGMVMVVEP